MTWDLESRRLYLCTPARDDLSDFVERCLDGGVDIVQLRDKVLEAGALVEVAGLVGEICRARHVPFIVNDRVDLALAAGADGVHVGQDDLPAPFARTLMGPDGIVGLSTHARVELDAALHQPVDYLSAGPVVATPTKPGRAGTGLDYVTYACAKAAVPVFITGGVEPGGVDALAAAGARHFVVVRYLTNSSDPASSARALRQRIEEAVERYA